MFLTYLFRRNKYVIFTIVLLTLSLFGGIYLVQQRQDLRQRAAGEGTWNRCGRQSGGTYAEFNSTPHGGYQQTHWFDVRDPAEPDIKKPWYLGTVNLRWQSIFRCDYQKLMDKDGNVRECTTGDEDTWSSTNNKEHHETQALYTSPQNGTEKGYSPNLGELIDWSHYDGQCQVIQVDIDGCSGGVVFTVYANDVCPSVDPTPTPTPTPSLKQCDDTCVIGAGECQAEYSCVHVDYFARERCRSEDCSERADCICPGTTPTPTATPTNTPTGTLTPTATPTNTPTGTLTPTATPTNTPTPVSTGTATPTNTPTPVSTGTATPTNTPTGTLTPTATPTNTPTNTPTPVSTGIPAPTNTPAYIAEGPTPTRIILPVVGVDFPAKILTVLGSIITLLGFLILL